ncbi:efflux RND transporter periplasmic adaptor subunit [Archangium lansingense]|uniref:efflux RND transporter periplasmic adaptor subunit n=1 Tax=Archangium lansingense TaxID=2995310 RepID=UPI003B772301
MSQRLVIVGTGVVLLAGMGMLLVHRTPASPPPLAVPAEAAPAEARPAPSGEGPGFIGVIVAGGSVDISAKFDGRLEHVAVRVGGRVRKGEVLARLDVQPIQHELAIAQADLEAMRAEEEVAKLALLSAEESLQRGGNEKLAALGAMSEEERARLRFAEKTAAAKVAAAKAQVQSYQAKVEQLRLRLSEATLRAPVDGTVSMRYLDPGALVSTGRPLVHLLADGVQQVRFAIPEAHALRVTEGASVLIDVKGAPERLEGVVESVSPEVDTASRMVLAIANVTPRPGQRLPLGTVVRVWVVPGAQVVPPPSP